MLNLFILVLLTTTVVGVLSASSSDDGTPELIPLGLQDEPVQHAVPVHEDVHEPLHKLSQGPQQTFLDGTVHYTDVHESLKEPAHETVHVQDPVLSVVHNFSSNTPQDKNLSVSSTPSPATSGLPSTADDIESPVGSTLNFNNDLSQPSSVISSVDRSEQLRNPPTSSNVNPPKHGLSTRRPATETVRSDAATQQQQHRRRLPPPADLKVGGGRGLTQQQTSHRLPESLSQVNQVPELLHLNQKSCTRPGTCLEPDPGNIFCFGTDLGYTQFSLDLSGLQHRNQLNETLREWETLRKVPSCWKVIQPLLCGVYYPRCTEGSLQLVPTDLCKVVKAPCRNILKKLNPKWDKILDCSSSIYSECKNDDKSERLRFNTSALCPAFLVPVQEPDFYFDEIEECGLKCESPLLSAQQHHRMRMLIGVGATLCLICTLFATLTFLIDWVGANKYPAVAIFYINLCCFMACVGWMAQLGGKEEIVCRKEGVLRLQEPGAGENLSCVIVFILVYYFTIAGGVWLVILTYTWCIFFTSNTKAKDLIEPKTAYFHMAAWTFPGVLSIIIMATNQVEGSSIYGICYIGYETVATRIVFLLLPYSVFLIVSGFYSMRCVFFLAGVYLTPDYLSVKESEKVKSTLFRIGFFSLMTAVLICVSFACQVYEFLHKDRWRSTLVDAVYCTLRSEIHQTGTTACPLENRPNQILLELQLLCMFGAGVLSSSWVFTKESLRSWWIFWSQLFTRRKSQRPLKLKKHQMIAQAFNKRRELQENGRLSLTLQSAHVDPIGMNVELGDESSGEISSTWAAALPHLVQRRGAACGAEQLGLGRRNSLDSVTSSVSQSISVRSNRFGWFDSGAPSIDSHSVNIPDIDRLQIIYDESLKKSRRKSKRDFFKSHALKMRPWSRLSRRGSSTSRRDSSNSRHSESSLNSQILPAITVDPAKLTNKHKRSEYTVPAPGKSIDFGKPGLPGILPSDPSFRELEEKLRHLATTSRTSHNTDRDGSIVNQSVEVPKPGGDAKNNDPEIFKDDHPLQHSRSIQTSTTDLTDIQPSVNMVSVGTQVTPKQVFKLIKEPVSTTTTTTTTTTTETSTDASAPLQHIEANVVSIKVLGPSSEDSSTTPSSFEKDFKMKKLAARGKENKDSNKAGENQVAESELNLREIEIPALKQTSSTGPILRPRDHYRGRRGAIVEKLSPKGETNTDTKKGETETN